MDYCNITPCKVDGDCLEVNPPYSEQKCLKSGFCQELTWCPENLDPIVTKNYTLQNVTQDLTFDFYNVIQFGTDKDIDDLIYSTYKKPNETIYYPDANANAFRLSDLLMKVVDFTPEKGGLLQVTFEYDCNLAQPYCEPGITITQLSQSNEQYPTYMEDSLSYTEVDGSGKSVQYRDYHRYTGIRILVQVKGVGKRLSIPAIIMQISSALALLNIATTISDVIMLNLPMLPAEHRKLYFNYKCENSEDFTNLQEKINLIKKE